MQKRLRSLQRILAVQKDLQRLAELKLAQLQRRELDLQQDQERLVSYLDEDHVFTPAYAKMIAGRLQTLAGQRQRAAADKQQQSERTLEHARKVGRAERRVGEIGELLRRVEERKELEAAIEAEMKLKQASLP